MKTLERLFAEKLLKIKAIKQNFRKIVCREVAED